MPSRLSRGNNTNAIARFEALFRVIARLSRMGSGLNIGRVSLTHGRQPAGFGEGWVAGPMWATRAPPFAPFVGRRLVLVVLYSRRRGRCRRRMVLVMVPMMMPPVRLAKE